MEIYVVRHGQTDYNIKHVFQGHIDIPLNETGKKQAQEIALRFKDIDIDMILVSPLQRTIQTAEYISQVTDIPITVEERIIERSFGDMEGHQNRENWNIKMMLDYNKNYNIENIEPIQSLFKRIYNFLDEITEKYKDKKIVLVTHGAVSQPIECYFNGMPETMDFEHLEKLTLKNCEVRIYNDKKNKSEYKKG